MATVFLGWLEGDLDFVRPVAIKIVHAASDARSVAMLRSEARLASRIRHPNVVPVIDVVDAGSAPALVLEYVAGEALSQILDTTDEIPPPIAARILVDALEGLHAAHEVRNEAGLPLDVVHRDVSPDNILVDESGQTRITDFGVAKALERTFTTDSGDVRGKIAYVSPEQLRGGDVDRRADIWAIGMVLRRILTAEKPFSGLEPAEAASALLDGKLPPLVPIRPTTLGLLSICTRALSADPSARFATAREMALALEEDEIATPREVARWLRRTMRASFDQRAATLAELERRAKREASTPDAQAHDAGAP